MEIKYELTADDFINAQRLHLKSRPFIYVMYSVIPLLGIALLFQAYLLGSDDRSKFVLIPLGVFCLLYPLIWHFEMKRSYKRSRSGSGECTLNFCNDHVTCSAKDSKSEMNWSLFQKSAENKKCFLIYLAPGKFLVIPKRVLNEGQIAELRNLLSSKLHPSDQE